MLLAMAHVLTAQSSATPVPNPIVTTVRQMEERYSKNLIGAAEEMPADKYGFAPTPDQMTFGHLVVHIASSNNGLCAAIAGEQPPSAKLSESDSKETLTKALSDSFTYCQQVLEKTDDSKLGVPAMLFGGHTSTRGAALVHLAADWADHYSAAAMYLRLNNLVPPSAKKADNKPSQH
jgi:uncharacterized damage-inducible protein DinB